MFERAVILGIGLLGVIPILHMAYTAFSMKQKKELNRQTKEMATPFEQRTNNSYSLDKKLRFEEMGLPETNSNNRTY